QSLRGDEHDYTSGSIRQAIVLLAIPMILELSLESVFAVVDMYFVGHMPNAEVAVATVGLTESMITIIYSIAIGLSTAATAMVSRRIGEKDPEAAARAGVQYIIIAVVASLVISAIGVFFAPELLGMMGAQPEVMAEGAS
ncbi:MAG: MATE family efflux transporter, partial [Methylophilaceae bacterium]